MPIIDKVIANEEGSRPVLVEFQNGKIKPGEEHNLNTGLFKTKQSKTVVGVQNNNMVYTGVVDNENELYNNFILIHDRKTDKIRLVQVDCCTVSPVLDKRVDLNSSTKLLDNSLSELNKQFGSKKTKRYTEQQERLKMNIDTVKDQLEKTVSEIQMDETDHNPTQGENQSLYRPKINREASTLEQVYKLEDLVPIHVLNSLNSHAQNIVNGVTEEYELYSFVSTNLSRILEASDEPTLLKIQIFLYIHYLIKFINTPVRQLTKKFVACDKSVEVNNHILDNYSVIIGIHRTRPLLMKDKALCYILVLAALAMNYQIDVEALSKDLKTGIKKVLDISRVLAFTTSSKSKTLIVLKLPLPAPVSASPRKRR